MKTMAAQAPFLIDIAANLTDCVFRGVDWKGKRVHEDDFDLMLDRAAANGVQEVLITGTSLSQCAKAIALCRRYPERRLRCTVGVHPAHSAEFLRPLDVHEVEKFVADDAAVVLPHPTTTAVSEADEDAFASARLRYLTELIRENRDVVLAVGEIGVDYAELTCCPRELQEKYFVKQMEAFAPLGLPFLFHSRDCGMRFVQLLQAVHQHWSVISASVVGHSVDSDGSGGERVAASAKTGASTPPLPMRGVVHSFNGSKEEQAALLDMGLLLSVNGSAFRTEALATQVMSIPRERLLLETDAPWCDIRPKDYGYAFVSTHFPTSKKKEPFVAGQCLERRNEPCHLVQVEEAYIGCANRLALPGTAALTKEELTRQLYENYVNLFGK